MRAKIFNDVAMSGAGGTRALPASRRGGVVAPLARGDRPPG